MSIFKQKPKEAPVPVHIAPRETPERYQIRGGWGTAINFNGYEAGSPTQLVYGFTGGGIWDKRYKPHLKDLFISRMESGLNAVWEFIEVNWESDPADMWTGKVRFIGYEGEGA